MIRLATISIFSLVLAYFGLVVSLRLIVKSGVAVSPLIEKLDPYASVQDDRQSLLSYLEKMSGGPTPNQQILELAKAAPLDPLVYTVALVEATQSSQPEAVTELSSHIIRLNPRHRVARFVRAQVTLAKDGPDQALDALARLIDLDPDRREDYLLGMVEIASTQDGRIAIEGLLATRPNWGGQLVSMLSSTVEDANFLLRLFAHYPQGQSGFVQALSRRGQIDQAYIAFLSFLAPDEALSLTTPYDFMFESLTGARPFNWSINAKFAGIENTRGLYISFFGRGRPVIASQYLALSPGYYDVSFVMSGELYQNGGHFEWSVTCLENRQSLMLLPITELFSSDKTYSSQFSIPELACPYQDIKLSGVAGEFPRTARAQVSSVSVSDSLEAVE